MAYNRPPSCPHCGAVTPDIIVHEEVVASGYVLFDADNSFTGTEADDIDWNSSVPREFLYACCFTLLPYADQAEIMELADHGESSLWINQYQMTRSDGIQPLVPIDDPESDPRTNGEGLPTPFR